MSTVPKNIKILFAPLDWGLGHATRCIPLIHFLLNQKHIVVVAATGPQKAILQLEFPQITILDLSGYEISYTRHKRMLPLKILIQIPNIVKAIQKEKIWLKKIIQEQQIDLVISDNRFGLYSKKVPCIFLTHQLLIKAPYAWIEKIIQKINYHFINKFTECWVPDLPGDINLAGALSHPAILPKIPVHYIGPLSRIYKKDSEKIIYNWLVILSGPEPQRTILEKKMLAIAESTNDTWLMVRGRPDLSEIPDSPKNILIKNHLSTEELSMALQQSEFVISRCGYTTVMEMLSIQKKCVLIPTPGQTEQEYLAQHLMKQEWCYCINQGDDLRRHLDKVKTFNYKFPKIDFSLFHQRFIEFLDSIRVK